MSDDEITPADYRLDATPVPWRAAVYDPDDWELLRRPSGDPAASKDVDITRELRVMYDLVVTSMDFGSGFLDAEDMETMRHIAELCDFDFPEYEVAHAYEGPWSRKEQCDGLVTQYSGRDGYEVRDHTEQDGWRDVVVVIPGRKRHA